MTCTIYRHMVATLLLALSQAARAGEVRVESIDVDDGNVVALLEASSQFHVDALHALVAERHGRPYTPRHWEALESALREARVARFEYRYAIDGVERTRVYHALSGEPLSRLTTRLLEGATPPLTPDTPEAGQASWNISDSDEEDDVVELTPDPVFAEADAEDAVFYKGFDASEVRAGFRSPAGSVMSAGWDARGYHALHAEYKALRAVEQDILDGTVPRGGRLLAHIGGALCGHCQFNVRDLARAYDVDVHVVHMFGSATQSRRAELIDAGRARMKGLQLVHAESGKPILAYDVLQGARDKQLQQAITPLITGRSPRMPAWSRRSLRLRPGQLPRVSEGSSPGTSPARPDAAEGDVPGC